MNDNSIHLKKRKSLTEIRNPRTIFIDRISTKEAVDAFIREDSAVYAAIEAESEKIAQAIEIIFGSVRKGGRLIYIGAGTSGRLGMLDAVECGPTFGSDSDIICIMAGGTEAFQRAIEGAEDDGSAASAELDKIRLKPPDILLGISASGDTPFVISGLEHARSHNCRTILLTCNPYLNPPDTDLLINPVVGPEIIAGSTRLKSGTACKLVLNMISSIVMIKLGKVYQNLMVDLKATNAKLRRRATEIVSAGAGIPNYEAEAVLSEAEGNVKAAIYMAKKNVTYAEAQKALEECSGVLYRALDETDD